MIIYTFIFYLYSYGYVYLTDRQAGKFQPKRSQQSQAKAGKTKSVSFKTLMESNASHQLQETDVREGQPIGIDTSLTQMTYDDSVDHDPHPISAVSTCSADIQMSEKVKFLTYMYIDNIYGWIHILPVSTLAQCNYFC